MRREVKDNRRYASSRASSLTPQAFFCDTSFGMLQGLWSSGTPCDVGISDAGGALTLTCEVMNFNVNQNLEEVVSADVTLKPTQSSTGGGMNVGSAV